VNTRNLHNIGDGLYLIYYKDPVTGKAKKFSGVCDNFNPKGLSAFWNTDDEQLLLVEYSDIVGLYPAESIS
jgi:hypothetical protein